MLVLCGGRRAGGASVSWPAVARLLRRRATKPGVPTRRRVANLLLVVQGTGGRPVQPRCAAQPGREPHQRAGAGASKHPVNGPCVCAVALVPCPQPPPSFPCCRANCLPCPPTHPCSFSLLPCATHQPPLQGEALGYLRQWVQSHPKYAAAAAEVPPIEDSSQAARYVVRARLGCPTRVAPPRQQRLRAV